jgi:hypothetical protein
MKKVRYGPRTPGLAGTEVVRVSVLHDPAFGQIAVKIKGMEIKLPDNAQQLLFFFWRKEVRLIDKSFWRSNNPGSWRGRHFSGLDANPNCLPHH